MRVIDEAHTRFAASAAEGRINAEEDLAFHRAIADAANNEFSSACSTAHEAMSGFMRLTISLTRSGLRAACAKGAGGAHRDCRRRSEPATVTAPVWRCSFHLDQARQRLINRERDNLRCRPPSHDTCSSNRTAAVPSPHINSGRRDRRGWLQS